MGHVAELAHRRHPSVSPPSVSRRMQIIDQYVDDFGYHFDINTGILDAKSLRGW